MRTIILNYLLFGSIIFVVLFSCSSPKTKGFTRRSPFDWVKSGAIYDTVFLSNKVITTISILDKYSINAEFCYDNDFSYLYPEYFTKWSVTKGEHLLAIDSSKIEWRYYFFTSDSILQYYNGNNKYYLIFNKPFYCNGFYCSDVGILILKETSNESTKVYYYDSQFSYDSLLISSIKELSIKNNHLVFPVRCEGIEKDSVCNTIVVDSLKI